MEKPNKSNALLEVMRETAKDVPAVRWAIGVVGLAAGVALISSFKLTLMAGLLGFALMIPSMVLLYLFSRNLLDTPQDLRGPKLGLVWFSVVLLILSCAALFTSLFWGVPLNIKGMLHIPDKVQQPAEQVQKPPVQAPQNPIVQPSPQGTVTKDDHRSINTHKEDASVALWEKRGDQAAERAIHVEVEWEEEYGGRPPVVDVVGQPDGAFGPLISNFQQAMSAWKRAADSTKDPKRAKSLRDKVKNDKGLTCENAGIERVTCYQNGSDYDVLVSGVHSRKGNHYKVIPKS